MVGGIAHSGVDNGVGIFGEHHIPVEDWHTVFHSEVFVDAESVDARQHLIQGREKLAITLGVIFERLADMV